MTLEKVKKIARIVLLLLIVATVAFIFVNSAMPPEVSTEHSNAVQDAVLEVVPQKSEFATFIRNWIRKLAHFSEYGLLGIELSLYMIIFERKRLKLSGLLLTVPFFVGFFDETIQIASGRSPAISDVWIDIGGFATFAVITYAVFGAVCLIRYLVLRKGRTEVDNG